MGTAPSVITAINKRQGPNAFPTAVWIDDGDNRYPRNDKLKFKGDPLALVLAYREKDMENWKITEQLTSSPTWDLLAMKEHVQRANDIKKYYRNKFMLNALKNTGQGMSKFRQDLHNYVESDDPYTVFKNDIPMIVKLPEFYAEDQAMDEMAKNYKMDGKFYDNGSGERALYPLQMLHRKTKNTDQLHYWFRDIGDTVYRISVDPKNPLLHLFEREFAKDTVRVQGTFYPTKIRGQSYVFYSLTHWTIV